MPGRHIPGVVEFLKLHARKNPRALLSLLGRVMPLQIGGTDGGPIRMVDDTMSEKEAAEVYAQQLRVRRGYEDTRKRVTQGDERAAPARRHRLVRLIEAR
jgi:hypothetical protein